MHPCARRAVSTRKGGGRGDGGWGGGSRASISGVHTPHDSAQRVRIAPPAVEQSLPRHRAHRCDSCALSVHSRLCAGCCLCFVLDNPQTPQDLRHLFSSTISSSAVKPRSSSAAKQLRPPNRVHTMPCKRKIASSTQSAWCRPLDAATVRRAPKVSRFGPCMNGEEQSSNLFPIASRSGDGRGYTGTWVLPLVLQTPPSDRTARAPPNRMHAYNLSHGRTRYTGTRAHSFGSHYSLSLAYMYATPLTDA